MTAVVETISSIRRRQMAAIMATLALSACGGRSDDAGGAPTSPPPMLPTIGMADASATEGNAGTVNLRFVVTLSAATSAAATIQFSTSDITATGADYVAGNGVLTFAAGETSANLLFVVNGDTLVEGDETLRVTLSAPSSNVALGTSSAIGTIIDDDAARTGFTLSDTGITTCANGANSLLACSNAGVGTDQYPRQDGDRGRDVTNNSATDGAAGFSFSKLGADGAALATQNLSYASMPWSCVRDNVTGLTWEIRTDDGALRDKDWTYSWYSSSGSVDDSAAGKSNGGRCADLASCDTEKYLAAVNAARLCGRDNWRLPTRGELLSIVHFGSSAPPLVDADYFPTSSINGVYWSSQGTGRRGWGVDFTTGDSRTISKFAALTVRSVSGDR